MDTEAKELKSTNELAEDRTNLAYERTALANDRTLMAWVRTATSLTSFGFTIYKFFSDIVKLDSALVSHKIVKPVDVGIILISFGFLGLLFGLLQYHKDMKRLRESYTITSLKSFTPVLASLMLLFSLILLIVTILRM